MAGHDAELEAGYDAARNGQADWCAGCDRLRYRGDMRWLVDVYGCRWCLPEATAPALWVDPWADGEEISAAALIPIIASVPRDWGSSELVRG